MGVTDAKPVPRKNEPYRLGFCIRNHFNYLATSWAAPTAYLSIDGSGFCNGNDSLYFESAPVEIDSVGIGYVDITASGMAGDLVMVRICSDSGYAIGSQYNHVEIIYPESSGDYRCDVIMVDGAAVEVDNVVDANVVQVSGVPVLQRTIVPANIEQVSGEYVDKGSFGGGGSSLTASDVWTHSDRTLTHLGEEAVSGDVAGAVWTALQDDYSSVSDSFGDYLDSDVSKVDNNVADNILASQEIIQSDINAISGDITNILEDTNSITPSGLATRSQLEYWGLVILNNCGGGPVG